MKDKVYENVFYFYSLNEIGGTEQFLYYLSCLYKNFVVFYSDKNSDLNQINRLGDNVAVYRHINGRIKCKRFFANYNPYIIDNVDAEEYIQVVHLNYLLQGIKPNIHPKITKCIGVSKSVCDAFTKLTGRECECIYNPCLVEKPKKVLRLISATRLSSEKGKKEMEILGRILDDAKIPYIWLIFTNDWDAIKNPHIIYMKPTLDIDNYIADSDYLVQLSGSESFCFAVVQALMLGIPVIVRELDVWREIGLNSENSFILNKDMSGVDIDKIYKGLKPFKYEPPKSNWDKYLKDKSDYDPKKIVKVTPLCNFYDIETGDDRKKGVAFDCTEKRKNRLTSLELIDKINT